MSEGHVIAVPPCKTSADLGIKHDCLRAALCNVGGMHQSGGKVVGPYCLDRIAAEIAHEVLNDPAIVAVNYALILRSKLQNLKKKQIHPCRGFFKLDDAGSPKVVTSIATEIEIVEETALAFIEKALAAQKVQPDVQ